MNRHDFIVPAIALGAGLLHFSEQRSRRADIDRLTADLVTLSRHVRDLSEAAEAAEAAPPAPPPRTTAAPQRTAAPRPVQQDSAPPPRAESPPPPAPSTPAAAMAQIVTMRDKYEDRFTSERPDPRWAGEASSTLKEKLGAVLPETSRIASIECRATMCRVETTHESMDRFRQFMRGGFMDPSTKVGNGGFFSSPVGDGPTDGKLTTVTYVAREGQELPRFDQER